MKKILSLCLFLLAVSNLYAQEVAPILLPVVDDKVMYEKIVDVEGVSQGILHLKAFNWITDTFEEREKIVEDMDAAQSSYRLKVYVDIYTINFTLQVDAKDNKYRCRIFDVKSTVTGKDESSLFSKYLVNVPAERLNSIVKGEVKGYSKGQKKTTQEEIILINEQMNRIFNSLQKSIVIKKADF